MVTVQEMRAMLQRISFPATREEIIAGLRRQEAPPEVLARAERLPEHMYVSVDTVEDALHGRE